MHNLALGGDIFHGHASWTDRAVESLLNWEAAPRPGPVAWGTSQGGPFIRSLEQPEPTADMAAGGGGVLGPDPPSDLPNDLPVRWLPVGEAAGSEHVVQHEPPLVFFRLSDEPVRRQPAPEQLMPSAVENAGSEDMLQHGPPLVFFRPSDEPVRRAPASEQSEPSDDANCSAEGPASIHVHQGTVSVQRP